MTQQVVYGFKRTDNSEEYVRNWTVTYDPEDMTLPESKYLPIGTTNTVELTNQLLRWFPDIGGVRQFDVDSYGNGFTTYGAPRIAVLGYSASDAILKKLKAYSGPCPCIVSLKEAYGVLREIYKDDDYQNLQYVLTPQSDRSFLVKRDPRIPEKRRKRKASVERRQKTKQEKEAAAYVERQERYRRQEKTKDAYAEAHDAVGQIMNAIPFLSAVGHISIARKNRSDDPYGYKKISSFPALKHAVTVYRRLVGGSGWEDLPEVRQAAQKLIAAGTLLTTDDDETHKHTVEDGPETVEAARLALVWWTKAAKRVLKKIGVDPKTPVETQT